MLRSTQSKQVKKTLNENENNNQRMLHLEKILKVIVLIGPFSTIPQIMEIWIVDKSGAGVSFLSWGFYTLLSFVWIVYGIIRKDKLILYANIMWAIGEIAIMVGAAVYDTDLL